MKAEFTIISGEAAKGLIATLVEINRQSAQLLADNEEFRRNDERFKIENEEFRKKLAKPKTLTGKALAWLKKEA